MSMAPGSPSVQSSSFNSYSSGPAAAGTGSDTGVGTGEWFKEHALIILLGVVSLVAIIWYLSRRGSTSNSTLSPDTGYPLGYPSVSGGAGASSGGAGSGATGTATTQDTTSALDAFIKGYQLRDGQITPQTGTQGSPGTNGTNGADGTTGIQGIQGNTGPQGQQGIRGQPGTAGTTTIRTIHIDTPVVHAPPPAPVSSITPQAINASKAGLTTQHIQDVTQQAFASVKFPTTAKTGTHPATKAPTTPKPKPPPKKPAHVQGGSPQARRPI